MKATLIKKFNIIVSLWLILIIGGLCLFAYELNLGALYIAAIVISGLLLLSNGINIVSGLILHKPKAVETKKEYN